MLETVVFYVFAAILLFGALFVLFATMFPTLSESVTGERMTVGPPFFNKWMLPIGLALLALTGPAAIAVVHLHVRDHALRQPALDERVERLFLHPPGRAAIEHAPDGRAADLLHHAGSFVERVDERRLLRRERLDAIDHSGFLCALGDRGEAVPRARQGGRARLAGVDAPLVRRAVHQVAAAQLGALVDESEHDVDSALPDLLVFAAYREACGLDEQPVQPSDGDARILGRGARRGNLRASQAVRLVRQRVRRDLEAVVAELGRVLALLRKRHGRDHLVTQRDSHEVSSV